MAKEELVFSSEIGGFRFIQYAVFHGLNSKSAGCGSPEESISLSHLSIDSSTC